MQTQQDAFERAKKEIAYAYENVAFFRAHLPDARYSPEQLQTPEDMLKVPASEKSTTAAIFHTVYWQEGIACK